MGSIEVVWGKMYSAGLYTAYGYCAQQTSDGGYVLVGGAKHRDVDRHDVYLIKTDTSGSLQWERTIGGDNTDVGRSIYGTTDGGYIITGGCRVEGPRYYDIYLVKTNSQGNVL